MLRKTKELLYVENIDVYYEGFIALEDVSIKINDGEIVAVFGENGSGKSTLLKTISGLLRAQKGKIEFCGISISNLMPYEIVDRGLIHIPAGRKLFNTLTVGENLKLGAYTHRPKQKIEDTTKIVFDLFPILKEKEFLPAGSLSGGEQQMLAIGRGLMSLPKLLMLDEPSLGLAQEAVEQIYQILGDLKQKGMSILLVEHDISRALKLANRAYVLANGKLAIEGNRDVPLSIR